MHVKLAGRKKTSTSCKGVLDLSRVVP
uniref:Uncharacterized protein n=1 Tax=Anguilla anguilla TaxID=7936 RepID=A0A0E9QQZ5_ANGAN